VLRLLAFLTTRSVRKSDRHPARLRAQRGALTSSYNAIPVWNFCGIFRRADFAATDPSQYRFALIGLRENRHPARPPSCQGPALRFASACLRNGREIDRVIPTTWRARPLLRRWSVAICRAPKWAACDYFSVRFAVAVFIFASALSPAPLRAGDPLAEPNAAAVVAAVEATDGLSALSEMDLAVLERDRNRDHFKQEALDGGTLVDARQRQREKTENVVLAMGEVRGKYAGLALLIHELWHLSDAEASLVTGAEPIDAGFLDYAKGLKAKTAAVRAKMRPLLPPGVELANSADAQP
jgi:hypothetical protein